MHKSALENHESTHDQHVHAGTIEATNGIAGRVHQRLAEKVEGSVDEQGRGGAFTELLEKLPKRGINFAVDRVEADSITGQEKITNELASCGLRGCNRGHETRLRRTVEVACRILGRNRQRKRTKMFPMLDVVV